MYLPSSEMKISDVRLTVKYIVQLLERYSLILVLARVTTCTIDTSKISSYPLHLEMKHKFGMYEVMN